MSLRQRKSPYFQCFYDQDNANVLIFIVIVPRQSGTPSATISYHGNQVPTSMQQPRTSPSANINHYGPVPPHDPNHPGRSPHGAGGQLARPGEAVSPSSQQPLKKRHRFHSVDEERMRSG